MSKGEIFALLRFAIWPILLPTAIIFGWHTSVFLVFLLSLYANAFTDLGDYHSAKAARLQDEANGQSNES